MKWFPLPNIGFRSESQGVVQFRKGKLKVIRQRKVFKIIISKEHVFKESRSPVGY